MDALALQKAIKAERRAEAVETQLAGAEASIVAAGIEAVETAAAPLIDQAEAARDAAQAAEDGAADHLAGATALMGPHLYTTTAAGDAAVAEGAPYILQGAPGGPIIGTIYRKTAGVGVSTGLEVIARKALDSRAALLPFQHSLYSHAIVDDANNVLAYIEKATGKWLLALSDNAEISPSRIIGDARFEAQSSDQSGWIFPIYDDNRTLLGGWRRDGKLVASLSDDSLIPLAVSATGPLINGGVSGPDICCLGDSLTASAGSTGGNSYPNVLATLTGRTVRNLGVGGENARTIAGRFGAWPYMVTIPSGEIPASGGVTVNLLSLDGLAVAPLLQGTAGMNPCFLGGVQGTLSQSGGVYTWTRATAGTAIVTKNPLVLVTDAYKNRRGDILILDLGQNGGSTDDDQLIAMHRAIFDSQNRALNYGLALGRTTGTVSSRAALHDKYQRAIGARFVNVLAYLSSYAALERAGVSPTTDDDTAVANGGLPPSFWASAGDSVHLNNAGYGQKAFITYQRLVALGWV